MLSSASCELISCIHQRLVKKERQRLPWYDLFLVSFSCSALKFDSITEWKFFLPRLPPPPPPPPVPIIPAVASWSEGAVLANKSCKWRTLPKTKRGHQDMCCQCQFMTKINHQAVPLASTPVEANQSPSVLSLPLVEVALEHCFWDGGCTLPGIYSLKVLDTGVLGIGAWCWCDSSPRGGHAYESNYDWRCIWSIMRRDWPAHWYHTNHDASSRWAANTTVLFQRHRLYMARPWFLKPTQNHTKRHSFLFFWSGCIAVLCFCA